MTGVRDVPIRDRMTIAGIAEMLIDGGQEDLGYRLVDAVRCCPEFPECSHVFAAIDEMVGESPTSTSDGSAVSEHPLEAMTPTTGVA